MEKDAFNRFYETTGICTDTRAITYDCFFVCIKGKNFDGNTFASKALEQGAKHVIVDNPEYLTDPVNMTCVEDSVSYIQQLANQHRKKFTIPVIGITGSNGKTTTKELMHAVLTKKYNVLATVGNLNNHLGVPFTLLRMTEAHEIAIIEMGANGFKDIEELCAIAEPTHGIITNIGKAHLEGFGDFEGVLKTKRELYEAVESVNGTIVFNSDDKILFGALPHSILAADSRTRVTDYGTSMEASLFGTLVALSPYVEMRWEIKNYRSEILKTQMVGKYNFYNYLAAISYGVLFEVDNDAISAAVQEYIPTNNRSQVEKTASNTLIIDCYNANPTSMRSAIESFAMNTHPDKLLILGDMKELGNETENEHLEIVKLIESLGLVGYTVGSSFGAIQSAHITQSFNSTPELLSRLEKEPLTDKLILLKGSRSIGLEKPVTLL
jgi:UDP-N-acetylmuramoyl-tripeptide--D-alanyl-D-alanine ligase